MLDRTMYVTLKVVGQEHFWVKKRFIEAFNIVREARNSANSRLS